MERLAEFIGLYQFRKFLIAVIIVMFLIDVILFFSMIVNKVYVELRQRKLKKLKEMYITSINNKLIGADSRVKKPEKKIEFQALGDVIIDMITSISGEMESRIKDYAMELGVDEYYKKMALSRFWTKRIVAVEKLAYLRLPELKRFLYFIIATYSNDNDIVARAVLGISFIADSEEDLSVINQVLKDPFFRSVKFNEYIYANVIKSFREKGTEDMLLRSLELLMVDISTPVELKKGIVEACGSQVFYSAKNTIIKLYNQLKDVPELKIICIRALGRLGCMDISSMIKNSLQDPNWRVRATAAKNACLCPDDIIESLKKSLSDENYYVRMNAAISLSKFGERGIRALNEGMQSDDRFAKDVSRYLLKLKEVENRV